MTELFLEIKGLEPCPRNRSHTLTTRQGVPMQIKTEAARAFEDAVHHHLTKYILKQQQFIKQFDKTIHALKVKWIFGTPKLYTASRAISQHSVDLDAHKVLQDSVMSFVGIDDAFIISESRDKVYSAEHTVSIQITIIDNGKDLAFGERWNA